MLKTYLYLPDDLDKQIKILAKTQKTSKAEVIRSAIREGIEGIKKQGQKNSAQALLDLAKMAEKIPTEPNAPKDISVNHDLYAWGAKP